MVNQRLPGQCYVVARMYWVALRLLRDF